MARTVLSLGPTRGLHQPDYAWRAYRDGDPRKPISDNRVNWRSTVAVQTSKSIDDVSGTFTITLKDKRARHEIREMDALRIRLAGHYRQGLATVMKGVVDEVRPGGSADAYAASEDTVISGRCVAKYLQVTSLFLPVWDPEAGLPTALTFGLGDAAKKVGGNRPYDIFRYLVLRFTYGNRTLAGVSGIPNSRYWLDHHTRFSKQLGFQIPYLQFDENSMAEALKRMEILGFTEAWVDELGRVVYRQPQWDAPIGYQISTNELKRWSFPRSDVDAATYLEVIPAGDPGIDSGTAQALRAGRAPVPSSYLGADTSLQSAVGNEFVIDTDSRGRVTEKGKRNQWYRRQRRLGLRPQQVTSPLLFTQQQAQRQAEGLLRFYARATKGMEITIPGAPEVRLGYTARVHGDLEGRRFDRAFYIERVSHDFVDGSHYDTTIVGSHGKDPWDPEFRRIVLPRFDPASLAVAGGGGVLDYTSAGSGPAAALAEAGRYVGQQEDPPGSNTGSWGLNDWLQEIMGNRRGVAWCGVFVGHCLNVAGVQGITSRVAAVSSIHADAGAGVNGFVKRVGLRNGQPGDAVGLFGLSTHVELIKERTATGYTTIGGNTQNGRVAEQHRKFADVVYVARPRYPASSS